MKVRSTVKPAIVGLRNIVKESDGLKAYVRYRWEISPVVLEDMNGESHTEYGYNEQEVIVGIPDSIIKVEDLVGYLEKNNLLEEAKRLEILPAENVIVKEIEIPISPLWYEDIEEIRKELEVIKWE